MKPLIIYHANCWDGFCAAWIANETLGGAELYAAHYGTYPPPCGGRNVYVLDFCYPLRVMQDISQHARTLTVIDHHKSSEDTIMNGLSGRMNVVRSFRNNHSGARLTWDYFKGSRPRPWIVDYVEDRDMWWHKLPDSQEVNAALRSYPLELKAWDNILQTHTPTSMAAEGRSIRRAEKVIVDSHVRNAKRLRIGGFDVLTVNATVLFSEIAGQLAEGEPFGACYFDRQDGKRQWSLRSTDGQEDVSEIAKLYGGGGHRNAAGFETLLSNAELAVIE